MEHIVILSKHDNEAVHSEVSMMSKLSPRSSDPGGQQIKVL